MANWANSMQQTYEYYLVDPGTWTDTCRLYNVTSCTINRDSGADTLGSASFNVVGSLPECYVRAYLVTFQNGITDKYPLGTFLVQTPSSTYNGKVHKATIDAYTPLLELKENKPPIGYSIMKNSNVLEYAYRLTRENLRAPVTRSYSEGKLFSDYVADPEEEWISYIRGLLLNDNHILELDEMGHVMFAPKQDLASMQPTWTFDDGNSSILLPEITVDQDLYGIPNVVEVIVSRGHGCYQTRVVNDDPNSPVSTINRGREIVYRVTDCNLPDKEHATDAMINEYAERVLRELSTLEYTVTFEHAYCPVRLGDCVRLNYERAGLLDVKAKIIKQSIKCVTGCTISETAVFINKLWR